MLTAYEVQACPRICVVKLTDRLDIKQQSSLLENVVSVLMHL